MGDAGCADPFATGAACADASFRASTAFLVSGVFLLLGFLVLALVSGLQVRESYRCHALHLNHTYSLRLHALAIAVVRLVMLLVLAIPTASATLLPVFAIVNATLANILVFQMMSIHARGWAKALQMSGNADRFFILLQNNKVHTAILVTGDACLVLAATMQWTSRYFALGLMLEGLMIAVGMTGLLVLTGYQIVHCLGQFAQQNKDHIWRLTMYTTVILALGFLRAVQLVAAATIITPASMTPAQALLLYSTRLSVDMIALSFFSLLYSRTPASDRDKSQLRRDRMTASSRWKAYVNLHGPISRQPTTNLSASRPASLPSLPPLQHNGSSHRGLAAPPPLPPVPGTSTTTSTTTSLHAQDRSSVVSLSHLAVIGRDPRRSVILDEASISASSSMASLVGVVRGRTAVTAITTTDDPLPPLQSGSTLVMRQKAQINEDTDDDVLFGPSQRLRDVHDARQAEIEAGPPGLTPLTKGVTRLMLAAEAPDALFDNDVLVPVAAVDPPPASMEDRSCRSAISAPIAAPSSSMTSSSAVSTGAAREATSTGSKQHAAGSRSHSVSSLHRSLSQASLGRPERTV